MPHPECSLYASQGSPPAPGASSPAPAPEPSSPRRLDGVLDRDGRLHAGLLGRQRRHDRVRTRRRRARGGRSARPAARTRPGCRAPGAAARRRRAASGAACANAAHSESATSSHAPAITATIHTASRSARAAIAAAAMRKAVSRIRRGTITGRGRGGGGARPANGASGLLPFAPAIRPGRARRSGRGRSRISVSSTPQVGRQRAERGELRLELVHEVAGRGQLPLEVVPLRLLPHRLQYAVAAGRGRRTTRRRSGDRRRLVHRVDRLLGALVHLPAPLLERGRLRVRAPAPPRRDSATAARSSSAGRDRAAPEPARAARRRPVSARSRAARPRRAGQPGETLAHAAMLPCRSFLPRLASPVPGAACPARPPKTEGRRVEGT